MLERGKTACWSAGVAITERGCLWSCGRVGSIVERVCLTESRHGDKRLGVAVFLKNFASGGGGFKGMQ